jgi:hypothetical protein
MSIDADSIGTGSRQTTHGRQMVRHLDIRNHLWGTAPRAPFESAGEVALQLIGPLDHGFDGISEGDRVAC